MGHGNVAEQAAPGSRRRSGRAAAADLGRGRATGHVLNSPSSREAITAALAELASCLRPGGLLALEVMAERFARLHERCAPHVRAEDDWVLVTRDSRPAPELLVRDITVFRRAGDGWQRTHEQHRNVMVEPEHALDVLHAHGVVAGERVSFGEERSLDGLVVLVGRRSV